MGVSGGQAGPAEFPRGLDVSQDPFSVRESHMPYTPPNDSCITEFILSSALKSSVAHYCLFTLDTSQYSRFFLLSY